MTFHVKTSDATLTAEAAKRKVERLMAMILEEIDLNAPRAAEPGERWVASWRFCPN